MIKEVVNFFDKLEDHVRARLSHTPVLYAFVGGIGVVLFWKGVWETTEYVPHLFGPGSLILGSVLLLMTGLFVSVFIGDNIVLSGFRREKKLAEKTEGEVKKEEETIETLAHTLAHIEDDLEKLGAHAHKKE